MKKIIIILISSMFLFSCGKSSEDEAKERILKRIEQQEKQKSKKSADDVINDVDEFINDVDDKIDELDKKLSGEESDEDDPANDPVYYDVDLEVISFNSTYMTSPDGKKIKQPIDGNKILLVKMTDEPYLYCELKTDEHYSFKFELTEEQWYNKDVGDVLHFDYILKDRFFKIDENDN